MVVANTVHSYEEFVIRRSKKRLEAGMWNLERDSFLR